jgi:hypothetical protein
MLLKNAAVGLMKLHIADWDTVEICAVSARKLRRPWRGSDTETLHEVLSDHRSVSRYQVSDG